MQLVQFMMLIIGINRQLYSEKYFHQHAKQFILIRKAKGNN